MQEGVWKLWKPLFYLVTGTNNEISKVLAKCRENTCARMPLNAAFSCATTLHCDWSWMAHMSIRCTYHKFEDDPWIVQDTLGRNLERFEKEGG